ncbi:hypothetical protein L596_020639 [Steinernema carpocapsae]|uniref:7TM GPCR serpentine receptor class x (Srx) domain-containing protein n=1 Tax=Steinernema carpocapsae TaxID=34508 RepID=A0A4U5MU53_STECR|nr:hypothetical protein L596_020639 [Steinernema carpocapsae]
MAIIQWLRNHKNLGHKKHLRYPCYKLMSFVSFFDLINLCNANFVPGIFSLFKIDHCSYGRVLQDYVQFGMWAWYAYCGASMVLAFNRLLEFAHAPLTRSLFHGYKAWFWLFPVLGYGSVVQFTVKNPFFFYIPDAGVWSVQTLNEDPTNYNHIVSNFVKFSVVTISYFIVWILMKKQISGSGSLPAERRLSIQALLIGVFAGFSTLGYIAIEYLPLQNVPFIGVLGMYLWASVHVASAVIYMLLNKSIRTTILKMLGLEPKENKVSAISMGFRATVQN